MTAAEAMSPQELAEIRQRAQADYEDLCSKGLKIDMTRGKPSPEQLDLSTELLTLPGNGDYFLADGADARNYGGAQGIPEARALFAPILGAPADQVIVGNNSSLAVMHDCISFALLKGIPGHAPWSEGEQVEFLCPSPGYDRHFLICETYGIGMHPVALTGHGPDMDQVEELVRDPSVRGIWCVPKYNNPTGEIYSDETIERLARMETGAPDFRIFWDNAYSLHHLTDDEVEIPNILEMCEAAGHPDRAFVFGSTSKITFGGAGLGVMASSPRNVEWFVGHAGIRTIGPDKLNQLRHVRFLKDHEGLMKHMRAHREIIAPKFATVEAAFQSRLGGTGFAEWAEPRGGYFVSVDVRQGCAARVVELASQAGISMVAAGQTFPYRKDPNDSNLRIAPTYPSLSEVKAAVEGIAICIQLAVSENLLSHQGERC